MRILQEKISDKRFLKLLETLIRAPIKEDGRAVINNRGCPQGSILSPIMSNVYLHFVIDNGFHEISKTHMKGRAERVRFADDMVFVFQYQEDAERFYEVVPKRLRKYGLELHDSKSSILRSGKQAAKEAASRGERLDTYKFLGFVCYWGLSRKGFWRLKYKSRSDRFTSKLNGLRKYLNESLNKETHSVIKRVKRVVKGWHAITDNHRRVNAFIHQTKRILFRWRNRKGGKRRLNWKRFTQLLKRSNFPETFKITSMFVTS